jgi:hypothetical protein
MFTSRLVLPSAVLLFVFNICEARAPQRFILDAGQEEASEGNPRSGTIWITVHTKNDASPELSPSDLEVKLDGKRASVSDTRRVSPTLHYCLLLDISGSTRSARSRQHDEAVALLSKIPRADHDYGLLVTFNDQVYLDAEGTDPQKLIKRINQESRGATAMYDAMVACSDYLSKEDSPKDGPYTLSVMFVLSDGMDNSSRTTEEDAERTLIAGGIRVYSIGEENAGNSSPDQVAKASKSLKRLVGATGGKGYPVNERMTTDQIVQDISSDLAGLYAVTLSSGRALSIGHVYKLEVRCRKPDCAVTAPREYSLSHSD